jgi:hypothetical protein
MDLAQDFDGRQESWKKLHDDVQLGLHQEGDELMGTRRDTIALIGADAS